MIQPFQGAAAPMLGSFEESKGAAHPPLVSGSRLLFY
jgi:hypothetical protein